MWVLSLDLKTVIDGLSSTVLGSEFRQQELSNGNHVWRGQFWWKVDTADECPTTVNFTHRPLCGCKCAVWDRSWVTRNLDVKIVIWLTVKQLANRSIVTTADWDKVGYDLLNGAIFSYFEWPLLRVPQGAVIWRWISQKWHMIDTVEY